MSHFKFYSADLLHRSFSRHIIFIIIANLNIKNLISSCENLNQNIAFLRLTYSNLNIFKTNFLIKFIVKDEETKESIPLKI